MTSQDTVSLEIVRGKLLSIAEEMGVVLARSSMSPVVYEVLDFACGVCDVRGQLVAQSNGIAVFTGTFSTQVGAIIEKFGADIQDGDVFLINDPFKGGTHYNDVAAIKPVFWDGMLIAYAIAISHWTDVGGKAPGSLPADSTEIFQEGFCLPGVRIVARGKLQRELVDLIEANVRIPHMAVGDLNASLAGVRIADTRMQALCTKYGSATMRHTFDHILRTGEQLSRKAIAALPDGEYSAEDWIDGDGVAGGRHRTRVTVRIQGERLICDFTGCCAQLGQPINCSRGALLSAVKTVFKAIVDPHAPSNEGWFRPLEVVAPDGIVFAATKPAPVGWFYEATGQASELIWKALAPIVPARVSAGSANSLCVTVLGGRDRDTPWVLVEPGMVGWGASLGSDGNSVVSAITNGDTYNYSVELLEAKFPVRVLQYGLNIEGGAGAGRHRGGFGSVREYEILADEAVLSASFGRSQERPWGLDGGQTGSCNYLEIVQSGGRRRLARAPTTVLRRGDRLRMVTGGGGGFGDPRQREPARVLDDVRCGYLTTDQAQAIYGVPGA